MYNRTILMGRLTADPELRQTQNGIAMCRFSIAVERSYARQGEERQTDFFNVTCWRQTAEFVCCYFSKGRMIHVEGKLQNDNYTDQNGVKHYSTNIIADNISFCGDKRQNNGYSEGSASSQYNGGAPQYTAPPQQQYQQPYVQPAPMPQNSVQLGNLEDFQEILNDGEVPF